MELRFCVAQRLPSWLKQQKGTELAVPPSKKCKHTANRAHRILMSIDMFNQTHLLLLCGLSFCTYIYGAVSPVFWLQHVLYIYTTARNHTAEKKRVRRCRERKTNIHFSRVFPLSLSDDGANKFDCESIWHRWHVKQTVAELFCKLVMQRAQLIKARETTAPGVLWQSGAPGPPYCQTWRAKSTPISSVRAACDCGRKWCERMESVLCKESLCRSHHTQCVSFW